MQLMFSFNHDNIVRAYYSSTYVRNSCNTTTGSELSNNSMLQTPGSVPTDCNSTQERRASSSAGAAGAVVVPCAAGHPHRSRNNSISDDRLATDKPSKLPDNSLPAHMQQKLAAPQHAPEFDWNDQQQQQQTAITPQGSVESGGQAGVIGPGSSYIQNSKQSSRGSAGKGHDNKRAETYLVQEFCDSGTLTQYMSQFQGALPGNEEVLLRLLLLLKDTANGLACLHSSHVVHGDLVSLPVVLRLEMHCGEMHCGEMHCGEMHCGEMHCWATAALNS
jgi:serine/threonine protein kinase